MPGGSRGASRASWAAVLRTLRAPGAASGHRPHLQMNSASWSTTSGTSSRRSSIASMADMNPLRT